MASTQGSRPLWRAVARVAPSRRGKRRHGKGAVQTPACLTHLCHALDVLTTQRACPAGHNECRNWAVVVGCCVSGCNCSLIGSVQKRYPSRVW